MTGNAADIALKLWKLAQLRVKSCRSSTFSEAVTVVHLEERLRRRLGRVDRREDGEGLVGHGHLVAELYKVRRSLMFEQRDHDLFFDTDLHIDLDIS